VSQNIFDVDSLRNINQINNQPISISLLIFINFYLKNRMYTTIELVKSGFVMKYPLHTVSKPVSGSEVQKLAHALKTGGYVANEAALALAKRIAARRHRRTTANAAQ
jgi:hypothetical protein